MGGSFCRVSAQGLAQHQAGLHILCANNRSLSSGTQGSWRQAGFGLQVCGCGGCSLPAVQGSRAGLGLTSSPCCTPLLFSVSSRAPVCAAGRHMGMARATECGLLGLAEALELRVLQLPL